MRRDGKEHIHFPWKSQLKAVFKLMRLIRLDCLLSRCLFLQSPHSDNHLRSLRTYYFLCENWVKNHFRSASSSSRFQHQIRYDNIEIFATIDRIQYICKYFEYIVSWTVLRFMSSFARRTTWRFYRFFFYCHPFAVPTFHYHCRDQFQWTNVE